MDWTTTIKALAPTVATALLGPMGGVAVSAIGSILGVPDATQQKIADAISAGQMTPDQITKLKELELEYKNNEAERGFKYAELAFKDVADARSMAIQTKSITPASLTWLVVLLTLVGEGALLFNQVPPGADPVIIGRVLGTMDAALITVLNYWFGSSHGSQQKTDLLAGSDTLRKP